VSWLQAAAFLCKQSLKLYIHYSFTFSGLVATLCASAAAAWFNLHKFYVSPPPQNAPNFFMQISEQNAFIYPIKIGVLVSLNEVDYLLRCTDL